mmetsp:Transcript_17155/g.33620  ORF Transcript_17155/g.33620 Transcript_17155/m.33620 type:complete len:143 (+) Transcript_17155:1385-1813(+)
MSPRYPFSKGAKRRHLPLRLQHQWEQQAQQHSQAHPQAKKRNPSSSSVTLQDDGRHVNLVDPNNPGFQTMIRKKHKEEVVAITQQAQQILASISDDKEREETEAKLEKEVSLYYRQLQLKWLAMSDEERQLWNQLAQENAQR